jgi:hypothetical protein
MATYLCRKCCNEIDADPRHRPRLCPACGEAELVRVHEREKGDDDGVEYGDPRDERDERRGL